MDESKVNALIDEQIAQLEKEKAEFQKKLDELKKTEADEAPEDVWPKDGDEYWRITNMGNYWCETWHSASVDKWYAEIGNIFRTKEDAEAAVQRLKDLATVRPDAKGFVPDWSDADQAKYSIYYSQHLSHLAVNISWSEQATVLYFETKEDASNSIRQHRAEWLRLLGVTEK